MIPFFYMIDVINEWHSFQTLVDTNGDTSPLMDEDIYDGVVKTWQKK